MSAEHVEQTSRIRLALLSIVAGVILLGLKYLSYVLSGSVALKSDAIERIVNVVAALFAAEVCAIAPMPALASPAPPVIPAAMSAVVRPLTGVVNSPVLCALIAVAAGALCYGAIVLAFDVGGVRAMVLERIRSRRAGALSSLA